MKLTMLFVAIFLLSILITSVSGATTNITANKTNITTTSTGVVNTTSSLHLLTSLTAPIVSFAKIGSSLLFIIFLVVGEIIIYKKESQKEKINYTPFAEYFVIALLILAIPEVVSSYTATIPGTLSLIGTSTLTNGVVYETEAILIIAVIISFAGFILFIKSLTQMLVDYTDETKREQTKSTIGKVIMLLVFIIFSPYLLIILFLGLSHILITINNSYNLSISQTISTSSLAYLQVYQTSYTGCSSSPQFWQIGQVASCVGTSILYKGTAQFYPYTLQIGIYQAVVGLITTGFSDIALNQLIFSLIFGIIMIVSFAVFDFKILKYLENINTEKEQESYREIKARLIQFTAFMLSPTIYIIFLIVVGAILSVIVGMIFSSSASGISISPIPAIFTLVGFPTTANIIVFFAGILGLIFLVILVAIIGAFVIAKIFASGVFSMATYWYFSDAPHIKAFGERIYYILIAIFVLPVFAIFFYSMFFGLIPSLIHTVMAGGQVSTGTVYGYTIIANNNVATLSGPGTSGNIQTTYSCNSQSQLSNSITYLNKNAVDSQNALGALLYSCQNYVSGYATSVLFVDIIFLFALIVGGYFLLSGGLTTVKTSFSGLTTSIKAGNISESFSTLSKGTGDIINKASKNQFIRPFITAPKQAYTYAKMPLIGTTEGAVLEGTVGTVGALAMAIPNTMIEESQKRQKQKMLEQATKDEFGANSESEEDYNNRKEKEKLLLNKLNNSNLNDKDRKEIYKQLDDLKGHNKILLPTGMGDERKEEFLNDMWKNHNGNINETISAWMNDKDDSKQKIGSKIYNSESFKKSLLTEEYHKNPNNIPKLLKTPYYSDVYNELKENINTREFVYLRAKQNNIPIDTQEKREQQFSQAKAIKNSYNSYKDAINENGEDFAKIDEGPGSIQEKKAQKEKLKINALENFNNLSEEYGYGGNDVVKVISGSNNFSNVYDATSEIYDNAKELQESSANLKTSAEKQKARENIERMKEKLDTSVASFGYNDTEEFLEKAKNTPAYKIAKAISNINNASSEPEKEATKNEFIKMLGSFGLKQKEIKSIEGNEAIQPVLMEAIERLTTEYSSSSSQELGELIKNGYENISSPIMAKTINIPKGILSNVDTNLKAMIANPVNQTFKEYYGSIRKLVNTTWEQLMTGSLDTFISTIGEQTNYYSMQIENSKKEIQSNLTKLSDKTLSIQEKTEIENRISSLKKSIMDAQTEIAINNKTASIYNKLPVFDALLQSVKEWNVAGIDDVVSQYKLQEKITGNQIATIEKEIGAKKKELADKQARIKTVKDSATEILLQIQIDKIKEKIESMLSEKEYLYAKEQGISAFLTTDSNGINLDEINKEATNLNIKSIMNETLNDSITKNEKLSKMIESYDKGKENYISKKEKINTIKSEVASAIAMLSTIKRPEDISKINTDNYTDETKQIFNSSLVSLKSAIAEAQDKSSEKEEEANKILSEIIKEKEHIDKLNEIIKEKHEKDLPIKQEQDNRNEGEALVNKKLQMLKQMLYQKGESFSSVNQYIEDIKENDNSYIKENESTIISAIRKNISESFLNKLNIDRIAKDINTKSMIVQNKILGEMKADDYFKWLQVIKDNVKEEIKETMLKEINMFPEKERDIIAKELGSATKDNIDSVVKNMADSELSAGELIYPVFEKINKITQEDEQSINQMMAEGIVENNQNLDTMKDLMAKTKTLIEKVGKTALSYNSKDIKQPKAEKISKDIKQNKNKGS